MARQQLPPQIKTIKHPRPQDWQSYCAVPSSVDTGINPQTGRRQQARRRYATERQARTALAEITDATVKGQFISRSTLTVEQMCAGYLTGRRKLRDSSRRRSCNMT